MGRLELEDLVLRHREELRAHIERQAGGLLRFESAEDLVHGLIANVFDHPFEARSKDEDRAWLFAAAGNYLAQRWRYWSALKRDTGRLIRTGMQTWSGSGEAHGLDALAASQTGVSTFAHRREQLVLATRALALLLPRDRQLVELAAEGLSNEELGERVGLSAAAAAKAKVRAIERLRKTHLLVQRGHAD